MNEILPGVFHWRTWHEQIGSKVDSYWIAGMEPSVLVDPRVPEEGLDAFRGAPPRHVLLTNRLHYRHSDRFAAEFGAEVWCHEAAQRHFDSDRAVRTFRHGEHVAGGVLAVPMPALTPEETAYLIPVHDGLLAVGDSVVRAGDALGLVPDELLGDDPAAVAAGIRRELQELVQLPFDTLLLAHGEPFVENGKAVVRAFLGLPAA